MKILRHPAAIVTVLLLLALLARAKALFDGPITEDVAARDVPTGSLGSSAASTRPEIPWLRPLFSRPSAQALANAPTLPGNLADNAGLPRLIGIIWTDGRRVALFESAGATIRASVDGTVAGWQVAAIDLRSAVLRSPAGDKTITLSAKTSK